MALALFAAVLAATAAAAADATAVDAAAAAAAPLPNIVLVLTDDAGFGSWPNSEIRTPALDALAAESLRVTDAYTYRFCSPTRGALLTGRYPWRLPNTRMNLIPSSIMDGTPLSYNMLPARLAAKGYISYHVGKYHQGFYAPQYTPLGRGFNHSNGFLSGGEDHFSQVADLSLNCSGFTAVRDAWLGDAPAPQLLGNYTATRFTDAAVEHVREHRARYGADTPFFLYLALHNTHAPLQSLPEFADMYANVSFRPQREYYAMMSTVDASVANVTAALKAQSGMWDNTIFVWMTDNGAPVQVGGSNYPLRGGKGGNFEGGVKVPALFGGGLLPAARRGATTPSSDYFNVVDLYATFLGLAGLPAADPGPLAPVDSEDLWPWLSGAAPASPRANRTMVIDHTRYDEAALGQRGALRRGAYKLLVGQTGGENQASWYGRFSPNASAPAPSMDYFACDGSVAPGGCLFAVGAGDATEHVDLAAALPAVFEELLAEFHALNATYHAPNDNPPSDEAGECAAAAAAGWIATPWRSEPLPGAL